jgi:hypothetical protein
VAKGERTANHSCVTQDVIGAVRDLDDRARFGAGAEEAVVEAAQKLRPQL